MISGAPVSSIVRKADVRNASDGHGYRIISGNVLTGRRVEPDGYLGFYGNQVTVIPEGDHFEFLGWGMPGSISSPSRAAIFRGLRLASGTCSTRI